jgi:putative acetyltransferase
MTIEIRDATAADAAAIRAVLVAAFPTPAEADLVKQLERDSDVVFSLIAVEASQVLGHVLVSRMSAEADGRPVRAVGIGPVAVQPERQRQGIGTQLVRSAVERLRDQEERFVFLVGDPAYYRRFGFDTATAAPFASPYAGDYFMALALKDAEVPATGRADYAGAFAAIE